MNGKFIIDGKEVELPIATGEKLQSALSALGSIKTQLLRINGVVKPSGSGDIFDLDDFDVEAERKNLAVNIKLIIDAV